MKSLVLFLAGALALNAATAQEIIDRIKQNVGVEWTTPTVDTFKAGDPNEQVTGIAVTMMATFDVLKRAAAENKNLIITHEPTFYSHEDSTAQLESQQDAVLRDKEAFIREHHLVVWRFHDHWHKHRPDGILKGMVDALGWAQFQNASDPSLFVLPPQTLAALTSSIKSKLEIKAMRVVGDPNLNVTKVALMPGAAGSQRQIEMLERGDVEVVIIGEVPEWETVEYADDAAAEGKRKALVMLTHIPSEQAGMKYCTDWLKTFITGVPISFVPARQPFWLPN